MLDGKLMLSPEPLNWSSVFANDRINPTLVPQYAASAPAIIPAPGLEPSAALLSMAANSWCRSMILAWSRADLCAPDVVVETAAWNPPIRSSLSFMVTHDPKVIGLIVAKTASLNSK